MKKINIIDMFCGGGGESAEIIDWSIPCQLISERAKPLADATLRRIEFRIQYFRGYVK